MAFNGLGSFSLIYDWVTDRNNGIKILATRMMAQEQDIADGLSNCMTRDGQSTVTNTIPFNNQQITLLASATTRTGAVNFGQIQDSSGTFSSASGINTYVGALDPAISAYPDGATFSVYFPNANTAAATATLNLGAGARNLVIGNGTLLPPNTILPGVSIVVARGTTWQYFPSAKLSVFGLTDGGNLATGASADNNTAYLVDCTGTARSINLASVVSTGDTVALTIFGTNNCKIWFSGNKAYGATSTIESSGAEGLAQPRYTGTTRGWVW